MPPCCGQPPHRRRRVKSPAIPANPQVRDPVRMLYLGGGYAELLGNASGLRYYVAPHRRDFSVERADANSLLCKRNVILAPSEKFCG
jgi:hypothetical protein